MREIHFAEFRTFVLTYIKTIEAQEPAYQSTEWFLLRYLERIVKTANPPASRGQVENSMRALIRYYVDQVDEQSDLGEICRKINERYRQTLRAEQNRR